ncbi:winged helix-turn-helix domain-containing protein [Nitrobacteraceae bacterium UC4446_H13]
MNQAAKIARLEEQLEEARYQIRLLKGEPEPFEFMTGLGLTKMEARLLQVIAQRGRVSKEAVFQTLYCDRDADKQPDGRSVEVMLTRVRKRLRAHDIEIQTLYGIGYAMTSANVERLKEVLVT